MVTTIVRRTADFKRLASLLPADVTEVASEVLRDVLACYGQLAKACAVSEAECLRLLAAGGNEGNAALQSQVQSYEAEIRLLKNQEVAIRRLKEQVNDLELRKETELASVMEECRGRHKAELKRVESESQKMIRSLQNELEQSKQLIREVDQRSDQQREHCEHARLAMEVKLRKAVASRKEVERRLAMATVTLATSDKLSQNDSAEEAGALTTQLTCLQQVLCNERLTHTATASLVTDLKAENTRLSERLAQLPTETRNPQISAFASLESELASAHIKVRALEAQRESLGLRLDQALEQCLRSRRDGDVESHTTFDADGKWKGLPVVERGLVRALRRAVVHRPSRLYLAAYLLALHTSWLFM
ncbi:MAG: uncharacterized protein KVP18_000541 [Porospora cf. gigantea A]|uniref:uncharacterized protein n=1 Tax=Porospora cf. gigantea A TaxID=2853593 RepID=UPI003559E668|nr:MAG: hypothetical protein KVP18_000541 [Porospora cf. gigantea A]